MLSRLAIHNLAIIENTEIYFQEGYTVLTGETGAGKSLVIDSLSLLLGERASNELIRAGEDSASIEGEFRLESPALSAYLYSLGVPEDNGRVSVLRVLSKTKPSIKVNGVSITLAELVKLGRLLADIHSQFDFAKILNPENYLSLLDSYSFDLIASYKKEYSLALEDFKAKKKAYEELEAKKKKIDEDRDFYLYQYQELKGMNLKPGEEEEIASELSLLRNYGKIASLIEEAKEKIDGDMLDSLYELSESLNKLSSYQPQYQVDAENVDNAYIGLKDSLLSLRRKLGSLDYDPSRLEELEQRDADLTSLKRKYHRDVEGLIALRDELASTLDEKSDFSLLLEEKKQEKAKALSLAIAKGKELSTVRKKVALNIEKDLKKNLKDLLLDAEFQIAFAPIEEEKGEALLTEEGLDVIDFLMQTNVGEGLKPLSKIISGGEASRIMLAFKAILIKANHIPTVVFDEIDTGISGEAAEAVAKKIRELSLLCQVIAITHLPQVASRSDHHILISKEVKGNRTYAKAKDLSLEEKILQVAYLISGGKVSEKQLEYAREMVLSPR